MGSPTTAQKNAAKNLGTIAGFNAKSTKDQLARSLANFGVANQQNKELAEAQYDQNSAKAAGERFAAARKLQTSASSVLGAAGNALHGSGLGALIGMLRGRTDLDTGELLGTLTSNQDAVRNTLDESLNANALARRDAASDAEFAVRGIEADVAAQRNNLNPALFVRPGTGSANLGSKSLARKNTSTANRAHRSGYITSAPTATTPATTKMQGGDYFDTLLNSYNRK